jgi:hypothetical protein
MAEPNLARSVLLLTDRFYAPPLLMLTAAVFLAWTFVAISDGASTLLILLIVGLLLTFAIQSGLLLAPAF